MTRVDRGSSVPWLPGGSRAQLRAPVLHPSLERRPPRVNRQLGGRRAWAPRGNQTGARLERRARRRAVPGCLGERGAASDLDGEPRVSFVGTGASYHREHLLTRGTWPIRCHAPAALPETARR